MKVLIAFAALAFVAVAFAAPSAQQTDKEKVETYAENVLKFAQDLLKEFPTAPASKNVKEIIERVNFRIKEIKSQKKLTNIVDTVANLALDNEKLAKIALHQRHPEQQPDDQTKVHYYAKNVLQLAKNLLKKHPNAPEAKEIKKIIEHINFRIEIIESQYQLSNIVDTVAYLVLDNEKLANIAHKLGEPIY